MNQPQGRADFQQTARVTDFKPLHMAGVGDVVICNYPNTYNDGTPNGIYKARPAMVMGLRKGFNDKVVGLDVFKQTTQVQNHGPSSLFVKPEDFTGETDKKNILIETHSFMTLPIELCDLKKGVVSTLSKRFLPDLISCRVVALAFNTGNESHNHMERNFRREGIFFREELVQPVLPDDRPDVMESTCDFPACDMQDEIDAITRWTVAHVRSLKEENKSWRFPGKATWPNWQDVMFNGDIIRCCSDAKAERRDSKQKAHRPS